MEEFNSQIIEEIPIKDLVLWTENPRDPIDENATDQEVVERAYADPQKKWNLRSFADSMGAMYDYSELPTVVYKNGKPVVYDGNRRIALAKIKFGYVNHLQTFDLKIPDYPEKMPCAVCSEEVAVERILRKHSSTGSWDALEREKFEQKYVKHIEKSPFLVIENALGVISANRELNQNFVKDEILTIPNLKKLGYSIKDGQLYSKHSAEDNRAIFQNIVEKIRDKSISTRNRRGQIYDVLDESVKKIIAQDDSSKEDIVLLVESPKVVSVQKQIPSHVTKRITTSNKQELFGEKLNLRPGSVNNLYRDICDLYTYWMTRKSSRQPLSESFPALIRMSLRLLVECAKTDEGLTDIRYYVNKYFAQAKKTLTQDEKTSLSNLISGEAQKIVSLLHTGAHNYAASCNMEQSMILSVLIGKMLKISHSKEGV